MTASMTSGSIAGFNISGFHALGGTGGNGVLLQGGGGNSVVRCRFGYNHLDQVVGGNGAGVRISDSSNNVIGVIGQFVNRYADNATAIVVSGGSSGNSLGFNWIGTKGPASRNGSGIAILGGTGNVIENAIIDWCDGDAVVIQAPATGTMVAANSIQQFTFNGGAGIVIDGSANNTIGVSGRPNSIGSGGPGIFIRNGSSGNVVTGNIVRGPFASPNRHGIVVSNSSDNTISNNVVQFAGKGIVVTGPFAGSNRLTQNSVFDTNQPIDLGDDGPTANDFLDADGGPNGLQNTPILTSATSVASGTSTVTGSLASAPNTTYTIEFFSSRTDRLGSSPDAEVYLGSKSVTTDGAGNVAFVASLSSVVAPRRTVSATATDPAGNTSEVSPSIASGTSAGGDLIPDGRATTFRLGASGFLASIGVVPARSYTVEAETPYDGEGTIAGGGPAPNVTVSRGNGREITTSPVPTFPAGRRAFLVDYDDVLDGPLLIRVVDTGSSGYDVRLRVTETTLFAPRSSVNGYIALVALQNTSESPVSGVVWIVTEDGLSANGLSFQLSPGGSYQLLPGLTGSIQVIHDGPTCSIVGGVYMVPLAPGSRVAFRWPLQEVRSYGSTDGK